MTLDLTNPSAQSNASLQDLLGNTVLFSLTNYPGGSGATTSFLRLKAGQGSTLERGYNTGGTTQFDTQKQGTKAIRLSDLPTITVDNTIYYEFRIDLNESNSSPQIALSKLQIFQSNASNLTGYNSTTGQLGGLNPVVNLNETVLLDASLNSGSGAGDVLVYLPGSAFTGNPYIYTYAEFQNADSGFEEFSYASTTALGPLADLSLTQAVSNTALSVGNPVTFTITLNNSGPANATGVKVKDLLPSGINFTNATSSLGTYNNQTGIWDVGNVASGSNATLTLTGTVLNAASTSAYTNVAQVVAAKQFDPDSAVNNNDPTEDDYTSIVAPVVKLDLSKKFTSVTQAVDGDNNGTPEQFIALPGDNVSFQIKVTNNGTANATDVKIKDDLTKILPVGLTVQSLGLDGGINLDASGGGDGNNQTVEVLFNSIAPGASKTITVNAKVSKDYITPINFSGTLGTKNPTTGNLNTALPEYYETSFEGTFFFNYNVQKGVNEAEAKFGFLNLTSNAEVVSVNQNPLSPGSITASARLDVSTYKIQGELNNGQQFKLFSIENLNNPNSSNLVSLVLNPDPGGGGTTYPYTNQSEFLPPGQIGAAEFIGQWAKINDPAYLANLATWMNLSADGNLSNTQDEQALINALADFIESGVYQQDRFSSGSFRFNNGTQTQNLTFEAGEFSPSGTSSVNILVTDAGAVVTYSNGTTGSFADLQAALDSFNFANPTGVNVTIQDTNGNGIVQTRLKELGGFDFDANWSIKTITVNSNVSQVTFLSGNGAADVDFSLPKFVLPSTTTILNLRGDNSGDKITGTRYGDKIEGFNGTDVLSGLGGNDTIDGGLAQDTLIGGRGDDNLKGGSGNDTFVFGAIFGNDTIIDFVSQDKIDLSQLNLSSSALDSNGDGIINAIDNLADLIGGSLKLDLTALNGGTISLTGVTSINMTAVVL